jgi:hypothetical protein
MWKLQEPPSFRDASETPSRRTRLNPPRETRAENGGARGLGDGDAAEDGRGVIRVRHDLQLECEDYCVRV